MKPIFGSLFSSILYVAEISARERENGKVTKPFNKILIPFYNGDNVIVQSLYKTSVTSGKSTNFTQIKFVSSYFC